MEKAAATTAQAKMLSFAPPPEEVEIFAWGVGTSGQLGHGDVHSSRIPKKIEALKRKYVASVACGAQHMVAVTETGDMYSWGFGGNHQLGHGNSNNQILPRLIQALQGERIAQAACGANHTVAVTVIPPALLKSTSAESTSSSHRPQDDAVEEEAVDLTAPDDGGAVYSWGLGSMGQLGHGTTHNQPTPLRVQALEGIRVTMVACGDHFTLAVSLDGRVYSWGSGPFGELGHGGRTAPANGNAAAGEVVTVTTPKQLTAFGNARIVYVACGAHHAAAVGRDHGELFMWGLNQSGQLGLHDQVDRPTPTRVDIPSVSKVACGGHHTLALCTTGRLVSSGNNEHGQLGHGVATPAPQTVFLAITALSARRIVGIAAGGAHSAALTDTGEVLTWGRGHAGQLGHGDAHGQTVPRLVQSLHGTFIAQIAAGGDGFVAAVTAPKGVAIPPSELAAHLRAALREPAFADVTFVVEGRRLLAHRVVVCSRCELFRAMLSPANATRESAQGEVVLQDIRYPVFAALLEFLYSDHVEISPDIAVDLLKAANQYALERLKKMCEAAIQKCINVENVIDIFQAADLHRAEDLKATSLQLILKNFNTVVKTKKFSTLSKDLILEIVQEAAERLRFTMR